MTPIQQEPTTAMRVIAAAEEMLAEGQGNKITWRAILARIGSGSSTTIMAALATFWAQQGERKKQQDQALSALSGISTKTAAAFKLALRSRGLDVDLWEKAVYSYYYPIGIKQP